jgi:hypothetical protein
LDSLKRRDRSEYRWKSNIKMDLREIRFECVDWIHLAQDREQWRALANTAKNLQVSIKDGQFDYLKVLFISFTRSTLLNEISYGERSSSPCVPPASTKPQAKIKTSVLA